MLVDARTTRFLARWRVLAEQAYCREFPTVSRYVPFDKLNVSERVAWSYVAMYRAGDSDLPPPSVGT